MPDVHDTPGYRKALAARKALGVEPKIAARHNVDDIPEMTDAQLAIKLVDYEEWMKVNPDDANFAHYLERYQAICDEIQQRADIESAKQSQSDLIDSGLGTPRHPWDMQAFPSVVKK